MAFYLRKADDTDCDLLFEWTNYPSVRHSSFYTEKIPYDKHIKWFKDIMKSNNCIQYIYMDEKTPIGQARIEVNGDTAEVSYSIIPEKRSQGYGKKLLLEICDETWKEFPNVVRIIGKVKADNIASQKAFFNAGYIEKYRVYEVKKNHF